MTEGQPPRPDSPQSPQSPPPQPQPGQQYYGQPPGQQPTNGIAVAAMVLGIIGAVFGTILGFFAITAVLAIILGVLAIIFAIMGRRRHDQNPAIGRRGMATAGLVLGIVSVVGGLAWAALFGAVIEESDDQFDDLDEQLEELEDLETQ